MKTRAFAASTLALAITLSGAAFAADFPGTLKVTFQTTDCNGATGLASVDVDRIGRIQPYDCPGGRRLRQVLTQPGGEVFLISEDEAGKLQTQIQRIMDARQKALEQQKPIVIQH